MANRTRQAKWNRSKDRAVRWFWVSKEVGMAPIKDGAHVPFLKPGKTYDPHKKVERAWAEWAKRRKERNKAA